MKKVEVDPHAKKVEIEHNAKKVVKKSAHEPTMKMSKMSKKTKETPDKIVEETHEPSVKDISINSDEPEAKLLKKANKHKNDALKDVSALKESLAK